METSEFASRLDKYVYDAAGGARHASPSPSEPSRLIAGTRERL
jgi:hypothetical protein